MIRRHNRVAVTVGLILLLSLGFSLSVFSIRGTNRAYRTLFFPAPGLSKTGTEVLFSGEKRRVPAHRSLADNAAQLVRELILGPSQPDHDPLVPASTQLLSVVGEGRDLYINLTAHVLLGGNPIPPERQMEGIATNLSYNFPHVRKTHILIDGQAPDFSSLTGDPRYDFSAGVKPRPDLLR